MRAEYPILSIEAAKAYESSVLGDDAAKTEAAMVAAGEAIGEAVLKDFQILGSWPTEPRILVLAGKGLNAGDALVAARLMHESLSGVRIDLVLCEEASKLAAPAARSLSDLEAVAGDSLQRHDLSSGIPEVVKTGFFEVVLDGIYGMGFRAPLAEPVKELIQALNERPGEDILLRASIDLPSGLGEEPDETVFRADFTYVPGVAKDLVFAVPNRPFVGRVRFLPLAVFSEQPAEAGPMVVTPAVLNRFRGLRPAQSDKRSLGHVISVVGSVNMPGAALMSSRAALHAGAGLLTAFTPINITTRIAAAVPEAMWQQVPLNQDGGFDPEIVKMINLAAARANCLLIGPGLRMDRSTLFSVCRIVRENQIPLTIDASALREDVLSAVTARALDAGAVVMTPHRGEYQRLIGPKEDPDDLEGLKALAKRYRVIIALKGNPTIVTDGERLRYIPTGGPVLSRGGTGDILAGMVAALLARYPDKAFEAAVVAFVFVFY